MSLVRLGPLPIERFIETMEGAHNLLKVVSPSPPGKSILGGAWVRVLGVKPVANSEPSLCLCW